MEVQLSTLCYLERDGKYLMLHRVVKKNDVNKDKWIGVGGHFERDESPEECLLREVREETGYTLTSYRFRGIVTFVSGDGVTEYMHLFTADGFTGEPIECDEGVLEWVPKEEISGLNIWEGDKIFFRLLTEEAPFFSLKLVYDGAGGLVSAVLDGSPMPLERKAAGAEGAAPEIAAASGTMDAGEAAPESAAAAGTMAAGEAAPESVAAVENETAELSEPGSGTETADGERAGKKGTILKAAALAAAVAIAAAAAVFWRGPGALVQDSGNGGTGSFFSETPVMLARAVEDGRAAGEMIRSIDTGKYTDKELILVNPWHLLPEDYEAELENVEYGHRMDECAAEDLRDMLADCRAAGYSPLVCSSYRERTKQETLFENDVRRFMYRGYSEEEAREETAKNVAVPGSSEHEAGLAADIVYARYQSLDESQENNATQQWLMEHCQDYGFILRYPRDKQDITGITYEPWHYRYVGYEAAEEIMSRGICLEEYLGVIDDDESFEALDSDEW